MAPPLYRKMVVRASFDDLVLTRTFTGADAWYLRESIVYRLGEDERAGLREFYRRAHALSLIPAVPELRFHAEL